MMRKRLAAALFALVAATSLCSCGSDEPAASEKSSENDITSVSETDAVTEPEELEADSADNKQDKPAEGDEAAEIQQLLDTYLKAMDEKDYDTVADVTDVELMYFMEHEETGTREQYVEYLKEQFGENDAYAGVTFGAPEEANEHAGIYNDFFRMMDEESEGKLHLAENFDVDGLYSCRMDATGISMDFYVIRINGEWKCDPTVGTAIDMYNTFSDMSDDLSADTDDISAEAEEAE